mmetsp:Transcript_34159/g.51538  ORF Transcript_34159/g.51538 Transcript_34159/m.51538 type:complete len:83 (-) Transcript_34159:331-579(-)
MSRNGPNSQLRRLSIFVMCLTMKTIGQIEILHLNGESFLQKVLVTLHVLDVNIAHAARLVAEAEMHETGKSRNKNRTKTNLT